MRSAVHSVEVVAEIRVVRVGEINGQSGYVRTPRTTVIVIKYLHNIESPPLYKFATFLPSHTVHTT